MPTTLIALHGFTQNGAYMRKALAPLLPDLPADLHVEYPDAPHLCSEASVERLYRLLGAERVSPPHRCWFDASDDGKEYRGLDVALSQLTELVHTRAGDRIGILGFSQGAILGAALAALSAHDKFPKLAYIVLVAGRVPRADDITPLLVEPLALPSLHVCGERDAISIDQVQPLADRFDPAQRAITLWNGPHAIPTRGAAATDIARFIALHHG